MRRDMRWDTKKGMAVTTEGFLEVGLVQFAVFVSSQTTPSAESIMREPLGAMIPLS